MNVKWALFNGIIQLPDKDGRYSLLSLAGGGGRYPFLESETLDTSFPFDPDNPGSVSDFSHRPGSVPNLKLDLAPFSSALYLKMNFEKRKKNQSINQSNISIFLNPFFKKINFYHTYFTSIDRP